MYWPPMTHQILTIHPRDPNALLCTMCSHYHARFSYAEHSAT